MEVITLNEVKEERFFNLAYDQVFKSVILDENNYEYLNNLLSDILEVEVTVKNIEYSELPASTVRDKVQVLDVLLLTKDNKRLNVELNSNFNESVKERNIMYYFKLLLSNYKYSTTKGSDDDSEEDKALRKKWKDIDEVIQINLNHRQKKENLKRTISIKDNYDKVYYDKFKIININVEGYKNTWYDKNIEGDSTHQELTMLGANKEEIIELGKKNRILKKIGDKVLEMNEDEIKLMRLEQELANENAYHKELENRENLGITKGIKKGIHQEKINTAKELIKFGMKMEDISTITKLTKKEIQDIKDKME